jgi:cobalt-zinc-cadmium efflux system membrane fusion protein
LLETEAELRETQIKLEIAQQTLRNLGLAAEWEELKGLPPRELANRIRLLGLDETVVKTLGASAPGNLIPVTAPLDGVIVRRDVVAGEVVNTERVLFEIADVSTLWITLAVPIEERSLVSPGQSMRFRPDGAADEIAGRVTWISTQADEHTRTVEVRGTAPNANGRLVANAFVTGRIVLREEPKAIVVPRESLHWDGNAHLVFVRDKDFLKADAPKIFHPRVVRPGAADARQVEIIAGVLPGEVVAANGSGILKAELLKSNLGAG